MNGAAKPTAGRKIVSKIIALAIVISIAAVGFFYGQTAFDTYRASAFTPPAAVAAVEDSIKLTPAAQRTFRATQPAIEASDQFNAHCKSTERTAAILGCYYGDRIYLFDVENAELAGAKEVTAAHELLHAQYARLNIFERPRVDALIKKAYQKVKNDPEIAKAMEYYREAEPGAELDELHSIIGTTISELDPELEQYYARYFADRASIVAKNQAYTAVFTRVNAQAEALQSKLQSAAKQIFALIVIMIWLQTGYCMVILSSAIKGISDDLLEAARIDGANEFQIFFRIIIPVISGAIVAVTTTVAIFSLKTFDIVRSMTGGQYGTNVIANEFFNQRFLYYNKGRASAIAVVLLILVIPVMIMNLKQFNERKAF